jgi:hypothetical protein
MQGQLLRSATRDQGSLKNDSRSCWDSAGRGSTGHKIGQPAEWHRSLRIVVVHMSNHACMWVWWTAGSCSRCGHALRRRCGIRWCMLADVQGWFRPITALFHCAEHKFSPRHVPEIKRPKRASTPQQPGTEPRAWPPRGETPTRSKAPPAQRRQRAQPQTPCTQRDSSSHVWVCSQQPAAAELETSTHRPGDSAAWARNTGVGAAHHVSLPEVLPPVGNKGGTKGTGRVDAAAVEGNQNSMALQASGMGVCNGHWGTLKQYIWLAP